MKTPIRWGIIGCGDVTEVKSGPAYQQTDGFELSGVMRRDYDKATDYAARHGVDSVFATADELINSDAIDAVYVATPPDSHKYYGLKVAQVGKPCCIEKPLSPSFADSLEIHNAFQDRGVPLFVAYYRRTLPRFVAIKEAVDSGAIGVVRHITWSFTAPPNARDLNKEPNWRSQKEVAYGGYFDDLASHGLDLFAYVLGDFAEAKGIATNQQGLYSSLDAVSACWAHTNGATGMGTWNFGCKTRQDHAEIHGDKGLITFSVFGNTPFIISNADGENECFIENPRCVQIHHVQQMADQLLNGTPHPSTGASALHTSWAMDRILGRTER